MKFKLKKNLKVKKKFIYLFSLILIFLIFLFLLGHTWLRPFLGIIAPPNQPAHSVKTTTPLNAQIYFSNELDSSNFSQLIINEIDQAQKTLEIAMYSFKSPAIKAAVYHANERGVKVTLILDFRKKAEHDIFFSDLPSGIKRLDVGVDKGAGGTELMHHKFALIDRGEQNEKLIFGSFNWTQLQEDYDRSFFLISANSELIKSFGREFDRLVKGESGLSKLSQNNYQPWDLNLNAAGINYEVWYSPGRQNGNIDYRILSLIRSAKNNVKIMVWDFTDQALAQEIIYRAESGLKISIIADSLNFFNKNSVFNYLLSEKQRLNLTNLEILSNDVSLQKNSLISSSTSAIAGNNEVDPFLHYHLIITDDQNILFGTNNWSKGGSFFNDESAIETSDPKIIEPFSKSFDYNYSQGKKMIKTSN